MSRAVLVTGGAGFIGSHVAERCAAAGDEVRVLDDLSSGSRDNLRPGFRFHEGSILDPDSVAAAMAGCDVVVHLAAFTSVPESFGRHAHCYRTNVLGTYRVLAACADAGVSRLVFASSSAVYGELPDASKREDETPDPISPYAISKLEGEHQLEIFAECHALSSAALRFFNVYGPRQPADSDCAAAIPIFFERSLRGQALTIYGDGRQTRDFVFVEDVADAVYQASQSDVQAVFNVGSGAACEIVELAERIQKLARSEAPRRFEALRPGDLRSSTADVTRAREVLGWSTRVPLETGLARTLAWQRARIELVTGQLASP